MAGYGPVDEERTPVVVAAAHAVERDDIVSTEELVERAARAALDDAPSLADRIQRVSVVVAIFSPAVPDSASELCTRLKLDPAERETTVAGGNMPQWLVTRAAEDIAAGRLSATLIAGAESARSARLRGREGLFAPRDPDVRPVDAVVGGDTRMLSRAEVQVGMFIPAHVYPLFDSVLAHRAGRTYDEQRAFLGGLLAPFTTVAAGHPFAWFRTRRSAEDLATPTADNRVTAEPYTKRMNAFANVDLGAALVVCSLAEARRAGVADRAVFIWSGADATDVIAPTARPELHRSPAIAAAASRALEAAALGVDDIAMFDLYSCFPAAVQFGADALGLAVDDPRGLTVTGGLPYFGGPGNNYPTHSIATVVDLLRDAGGHALVTALGGFITKHAVGVYGREPSPHGFRRGDTSAEQEAIDAAELPTVREEEATGAAVVEASTVVYGSDGAVDKVPVVARLEDGRRVMALAAEADRADVAAAGSLIGRTIQVAGTPPTFHLG